MAHVGNSNLAPSSGTTPYTCQQWRFADRKRHPAIGGLLAGLKVLLHLAGCPPFQAMPELFPARCPRWGRGVRAAGRRWNIRPIGFMTRVADSGSGSSRRVTGERSGV
jgi:hypothetical protein